MYALPSNSGSLALTCLIILKKLSHKETSSSGKYQLPTFFHYILSNCINMDRIENSSYNSSSMVAYIFVVAGTVYRAAA
jgi:hypothetical protein